MLIEKTGTMPEKEQALHDLDMERLLNRIDPAMDAHRAIVFLHQYLCWDGEEITARSLLLQEFREKSSLSELVDLSRDLAALTEEARKLEQSGDRLHLLLYTGRRMEIYIRAVEKIYEIGSRGFSSTRMQHLTAWMQEIRGLAMYQSCCKALKQYHEMIVFPHRMRVGINTQEDARPLEMGVLEETSQEQTESPLIGTGFGQSETRSLFPRMSYTREAYGTHFEEYLSRQLEKQWKGKVTKALELWKKLEAPQAEALSALSDEFAFYAEGLRTAEAFEKRGCTVCIPKVGEGLLHAQELFYPELVLASDQVEGNPAALLDGGSVIVTGANHSGKTSYLKTIGQTLLLAQLGFAVPGAAVEFRPVKRIFTLFSAGEDRAMTASRMGVEIKILAEMLEQVESEDLVLINEPLTSTNPVEAISICGDLVEKFLEKRVTCMMVTHLYDVYFLLRSTLPDSLQPRLVSLVTEARYQEKEGMIYSYRLRESEPLGNSYARQTAEAFGITLEDLVGDSNGLRQAAEFCEKESSRAMYTREEAQHGISHGNGK